MNSSPSFPGARSLDGARRAFTLIEMLVVIAIIAILSAILFPVFSRVREGGRTTACNSNMKQLGLGFLQYLQDDGGRYPGSGQYQKWGNGGHWVAGLNDANDAGTSPGGKLADLAKKEPIVNPGSPTGFNNANIEAGALFPYVKDPKVYVCPSNESGDKKRLSYSMNCALNGMGQQRIKEPSFIILLVDEDRANDGYLYTGTGSTDELTLRHNGGGNLLFADGHAKFYTFKGFPMDADSSATGASMILKTKTTLGEVRFQDKAFGAKGYYEEAKAFGSCAAPALVTP